MQVLEALCQVVAILHGERDQVGLQARVLQLDCLPPGEIRGERFGPAPDGAERAEQVLFAELGSVQLDLIDGVKVPKQQVIPAAIDPCSHGLMPRRRGHILRYIESAFLCFAVAINPLR